MILQRLNNFLKKLPFTCWAWRSCFLVSDREILAYKRCRCVFSCSDFHASHEAPMFQFLKARQDSAMQSMMFIILQSILSLYMPFYLSLGLLLSLISVHLSSTGLFFKLITMLMAGIVAIPLGLLHLQPLQVWNNSLWLQPSHHLHQQIMVSLHT